MFYTLPRNKILGNGVSEAMHTPFGLIARLVVRTGALVALAMLLILGLLPAILAAEAAGL
jgi:hypothetical protein